MRIKENMKMSGDSNNWYILSHLILSYFIISCSIFFLLFGNKNSKVEIIDKNKKNEKKISLNVEREVERNRKRKKWDLSRSNMSIILYIMMYDTRLLIVIRSRI